MLFCKQALASAFLMEQSTVRDYFGCLKKQHKENCSNFTWKFLSVSRNPNVCLFQTNMLYRPTNRENPWDGRYVWTLLRDRCLLMASTMNIDLSGGCPTMTFICVLCLNHKMGTFLTNGNCSIGISDIV